MKKHIHLRYGMSYDDRNDPNFCLKHPQKVMRLLGIKYQHATPQSISGEWWFWNCENVPEKLPKYLEPLNVNPMEAIGWGLSKKEAEYICNYEKQ